MDPLSIQQVADLIGTGKVVVLAVQPPLVLNPEEIAKQLRVSHDTVLEWIRRGQLKASNLASGSRPRYVVTPDELAAFLKSRQPEPPRLRTRRPRKPPTELSDRY
jgi:excisionase family DNA binding protein